MKKKKSTAINLEEKDGLLENIIKHLPLLKKLNVLIVGTNAVFRGIEKGSVDTVLLVSRKASSVLYQALNLHCRNGSVLLLKLNNQISSISSTCCGIQFKGLSEHKELSGLVERINAARNSLKCKIQQKHNIPVNENSETKLKKVSSITGESAESGACETNPKNDKVHLLHIKHAKIQPKRVGNAETFLSLDVYSPSESDFPNYKSFRNQIKFSIH